MPSVVARAPGRVTFAGAGTDFPAYYERFGGAVVAAAIPVGAIARVDPLATGLELISLDDAARERIAADRFARRVRHPFLGEEPLIVQKAIAWHFGLDRGRIVTSTQHPTGSGLGSSAALCVASVAAAADFLNEHLDRRGVAEVSARVEMTILRRPRGKHDHYLASFGGLAFLEFARDGSVAVKPLRMTAGARYELEQSVILLSNGSRMNGVRSRAALARRIATDDHETLRALSEIKGIAHETRIALERADVAMLGDLLRRGWRASRRMFAEEPAPEIDRALTLAARAGAYGGKPAGSGTSGALLVACPPGAREEIRVVLATQGWRAQPFRVEESGVLSGEPAEDVRSG